MLMFCLNQIIKQMGIISSHIDYFYETIPQQKRNAIDRRDWSPGDAVL